MAISVFEASLGTDLAAPLGSAFAFYRQRRTSGHSVFGQTAESMPLGRSSYAQLGTTFRPEVRSRTFHTTGTCTSLRHGPANEETLGTIPKDSILFCYVCDNAVFASIITTKRIPVLKLSVFGHGSFREYDREASLIEAPYATIIWCLQY